MSTVTNAAPPGRRARRHAETRAEILAAAWELARAHGLAGLSMRDLGTRVGMRAPSLYGYFASKDEIYDAMFRQGYEEFRVWMSQPAGDGDAGADVAALHRLAHRYFEFCVLDPVRYQLLFQRTIPGFTPSQDSYAVAVAALDGMREEMTRAGITDPDALDLATAMLTGLTSQQLANDPGGDRWARLLDRAVAMLLDATAPHLLDHPRVDRPPSRTSRRATS